MFPRLFVFALALLAFTDVAFGRISGNSAPHVLAARSIASNKAGNPKSKGRSRSLSNNGNDGNIHDSLEKLKPTGTKIWHELKEWKDFDAFGPEKKQLEFGRKAKLNHKKRPGKLRKLKDRRRRLSEEETDRDLKEPVPNFVIP